MRTQQTDRRGELAVAIAKLREPIQKLLPVWVKELEAKKDETTDWQGAFDLDDGFVLKPNRKPMSLAGKAALLAAMHDVVFEGEGVKLMGLWHGLSVGELKARGLKELRAATAFQAMMKRTRRADWREFAVLECLLVDLTDDGAVPVWNSAIGELSLSGVLVKKYRHPAKNQRLILNAFQEEGWPRKVDDPLPGVHDADPKRRLSDTVRSLNDNRKNDALHFECDGTGEGVIWSTPN